MSCYKALIREGNWTSGKFRSLLANNVTIALDVMRESFSVQKKKQQLLDIVAQSQLSVSVLHVASQLLCFEAIPAAFFRNFVERAVKNLPLIKDAKLQRQLVRCFCFFLSGVYKKGVVDLAVWMCGCCFKSSLQRMWLQG